jgi:DNA-binding NarL/FixJ family response regulator
MKTTLFVLDDHKIIRDGLKSIFNNSEEFQIIGDEGDPSVFLKNLPHIDCDILVLDLTFPHVSGFELIPKIRELRPSLKILVLSMHDNPDYMQRCALLGAQGYLPKDSDSKTMLKALETIAKGSSSFAPSMNRPSMQQSSKQESPLSPREADVLRLQANGHSSKQIAEALNISYRTVEVHRLNIMKKLETSNSAETVSVAIRLGLL